MNSNSKIKYPLFWAAVLCIYVALLIEIGSSGWVTPVNTSLSRPGVGIPYLALFDGILVWILSMMGLSMLIKKSTHGRIQGMITLFYSIILMLYSALSITVVFGFLMMLVMLFLATPFGTISYLSLYGNFPVEAAAATLSLIMLLKISSLGCLLFSHQGFIKNKFLMCYITTSIGLVFLITILHTYPPIFLASITDAIGALITVAVSLVMSIILLVGTIPSVIKAIKG